MCFFERRPFDCLLMASANEDSRLMALGPMKSSQNLRSTRNPAMLCDESIVVFLRVPWNHRKGQPSYALLLRGSCISNRFSNKLYSATIGTYWKCLFWKPLTKYIS